MYPSSWRTCPATHIANCFRAPLPGLPAGESNLRFRNSPQLPSVFTYVLPWGFLAYWGNHVPARQWDRLPAASRSPSLLTHPQCSDPAFSVSTLPLQLTSTKLSRPRDQCTGMFQNFLTSPTPPREVAALSSVLPPVAKVITQMCKPVQLTSLLLISEWLSFISGQKVPEHGYVSSIWGEKSCLCFSLCLSFQPRLLTAP